MKRMFWALGVGTLGLFLAVAGFPQRQACAALEDTTPPTGTIVVNGNRSTVNSTHVTLTLAWSDGTGSGVTRMRFSDDGARWTRWEPLAATVAHVLPDGDGHKTVRVQFLDRANNYSAVFSDYVLLDMTPPVGTIVINNGASTTSSLAVTLGLTWSDGAGSGVRRMRFSNNGAYWTAWMPPAAARAHTLPGAAEYNTVRVQFLDGAGNYSAVYKDFIRLLPRTVPNVVGLAQAAAESAVRGAGLAVGAVTRAYSETVASGSVITQNPAVGVSASPGSAVALVISLGSSVTVPDVRGLTQVAAGAALIGASLVTGTVTQQCSNTVANGLVISQSPSAPGPAPLGTAVDLVISTGLCSVTVPDVVGLSQSAAEAAVLAADLSVGTVTAECSNAVAAGDVISQNPVAPGPALFGSAVDLVVSTGLCSVVVPDVVGLAQSAAEAALLAADLAVGSVTTECSNSVASGNVISQNPTAPGPALFGSAVDLVVSTGLCSVAVPDVAGLAQSTAETAVLAAGLVVGTVSTECSNTVADGLVISQNPSAPGPVLFGSAVDLVVSTGLCSVAVPDVTGLAQSEAQDALLAAGLVVGSVATACSDTVAEGLVVSQSPSSPGPAPYGGPVNLVVSTGPCNVAVEMVSVPAGAFTMGNCGVGDDAAVGQPDELPAHSVTLSAYGIGKYEVTNRQYCDVLNWALAQGYLKDSSGDTWTGADDIYAGGDLQRILSYTDEACNIQYSGGVFSSKTRVGLPALTDYSMDTHPVVDVSWYGSAAFCNWLSLMEGLTPCYDMSAADWPLTVAPPTPGGYRLPTEAEWECAAAWDGTIHWVYAFTSDTLSGKDRCNYYDSAPDFLNPFGLATMPYTSPVGWFNGVSVSPSGNVTTVNSMSPAGCYDMSGNAWEWCGDGYLDTYYSVSPPTNPTGPASSTVRVIRGGSWGHGGSGGDGERCAGRGYDAPWGASDGIGFRVARS